MTSPDATELLRPGLLEGLSLLVAGPPPPPPAQALGAAVAQAFSGLGATVSTCVADAEAEPDMDRAVAQVLADAGALHVLAVDGAGLFARELSDGLSHRAGGGVVDGGGARGGVVDGGGAGVVDGGAATIGVGHPDRGTPHAALRACMDATWNITRAVVNLAFLAAAPDPPTRRIVYLAPAPGLGEHAQAARAGLENLARTLSVEWARHHINVVAIAPGGRESDTSAGDVAALVAYLASPAGAYFSGCLLDLGGAASARG